MAIDPVLVLADALREGEKRLLAECKRQTGRHCAKRAAVIAEILRQVRNLHREMIHTAPTSAVGSSELIRIVSQRLPSSHESQAWHLKEIAERLAEGRRLHSDLIWIRALTDALAAGGPDPEMGRSLTLLTNAVRGAAMPVLVYRQMRPRPDLVPTLEDVTRTFFASPRLR